MGRAYVGYMSHGHRVDNWFTARFLHPAIKVILIIPSTLHNAEKSSNIFTTPYVTDIFAPGTVSKLQRYIEKVEWKNFSCIFSMYVVT